MTIFRLNFLLQGAQVKMCQNPSPISTTECSVQLNNKRAVYLNSFEFKNTQVQQKSRQRPLAMRCKSVKTRNRFPLGYSVAEC